jgi:Flp pilus assembly pilin Flp
VGNSIGTWLSRIRRDQGQTLVEYALLLMLIAAALIGALTQLDQALTDFFQQVLDDF